MKMLQEISRTSIPITKQEEASLLWQNSVLTVRTEKEIFFFEYSYNLDCLDKKIDYVSCSITVSKSSPLTGCIPQHLLNEGVSNLEYTEMILDPSLWPHNPTLVQEMTNIVDAQWSPIGQLPGKTCALAVLNNIGNVDIYAKGRFMWTHILDLSDTIKQKYLPEKLPKTLRQLKVLANILETSAFAWSPNLEQKFSSLFATAQKNGNVLFWLLQLIDNDLIPQFLGEIQTDFGEIVTMTWIPASGNNFLIVCSNVHGQIFAIDFCITNSQVYVNNYHTIWEQKDKMITKLICYKIIDDKIVLFCNKYRHLLAILLDGNCSILSQSARNINDYRITDIKANDYGIFLTTVNCKIYKTIPKLLNNDLDFDIELIECNVTDADMYGIEISSNNLLWAVVTKDRKVMHRQRRHKTVDLTFYAVTNPEKDELTSLLGNPTQKLTNYWDCIELLRYKTMKTKNLPKIDFHELYYQSEKDIYKLKLYFILVHFFISLEKQVRNKSRLMLPEMNLNAIKEKILVLHASQLITEAHEHQKNDELEHPLVETYTGAKRFLQYYCEKENKDIRDFVNATELSQKRPKIEAKVICQGCDEFIRGFTCSNGHFNMFCSLTFTPIDGYEYLVCRSCGSTARSELFPSNPKCVFCDQYLCDSQWQQWMT